MKHWKVYFDFRDWWIGWYRGDEHDYFILIPTLVMRRRRILLPVTDPYVRERQRTEAYLNRGY